MRPHPALVCCSILVATACSDGSGPTPPGGAFSAQLTGGRTGTLSGAANAGKIFVEENPDGVEFVIRMYDESGGVLRFLLLECPGETAPTVGTHAIGPAAECQARYARSTFPPEGGEIVSERMDAAAGSLTVSASTADELDGTFAFHGELTADSASAGTLSVAGTFRAIVFP